jgi:hypothetical protein
MKRNLGTTDKVIRILVAVIVAVLLFLNVISGIFGIVLLIVAGIFVLTSLINFCPLYFLFGISTHKKK